MAKFLDSTGLQHLINWIKSLRADWNQTDNTVSSYIQNKPAIKAGEGQNSIAEGSIEEPWYSARYTIYITGSGHNFTYTTEDTIPSITLSAAILVDGSSYREIEALDTVNQTISINFNYVAQTNREVYIYIIQSNAAFGSGSHAEGHSTLASGGVSHAEGNLTRATGAYSHAENYRSIAYGSYSHAEGNKTLAYGLQSHAEGQYTEALGSSSHAEGRYMIVNHRSQHGFGEYNAPDESAAAMTAKGNYIEIVGNGTSESARSNARTLDWSGNEVLAGKLTVGSDPTQNMDVTTKQYVDNLTNTKADKSFVVTLSYNSENDSWSCNKTGKEIYEAYANDGKNIMAVDSNKSIYTMSYAEAKELPSNPNMYQYDIIFVNVNENVIASFYVGYRLDTHEERIWQINYYVPSGPASYSVTFEEFEGDYYVDDDFDEIFSIREEFGTEIVANLNFNKQYSLTNISYDYESAYNNKVGRMVFSRFYFNDSSIAFEELTWIHIQGLDDQISLTTKSFATWQGGSY